MNKIQLKSRGTRLFFIELLFAIFFFCIICAACIRIFSDAYVLSKKSSNLTQGVNVAANIAEFFNHWDGTKDTWEQVFPNGSWKEQGEWHQEYDSDWQPVSSQGTFYAKFQMTDANTMLYAKVTVGETKKQGQTRLIYQLDLERRPYPVKI